MAGALTIGDAEVRAFLHAIAPYMVAIAAGWRRRYRYVGLSNKSRQLLADG